MRQIADWLQKLGLRQYAQRFGASDVKNRQRPGRFSVSRRPLGTFLLGYCCAEA
jgi:hypothetical protein